MMRLGGLSVKYESKGDPATISDGSGDGGGISYGIYQFSSNMGVVQKFVEWLQEQPYPYSEYGNLLARYEINSDEFIASWRELGDADTVGFAQLQEDYVKPTYFDVGANNLWERYGFDIRRHSEALQSVLWSNCVQHGNYYGAQVFGDAAELDGQDLYRMSDVEIIQNIYEVKLTDMSWSSGAPELRSGLFNRWRNERQDALAMLDAEQYAIEQQKAEKARNCRVE